MKLSAIFRKAAARIQPVASSRSDNCCCWAIHHSEHGPAFRLLDNESAAQVYFAQLFKPKAAQAFWWDYGRCAANERRLALLFAAAIAESEGL